MENLLKKVSILSSRCFYIPPGIFRVLLNSAEIQPSSSHRVLFLSTMPPSNSSDTLLQRLHSCFDPKASIIPALDQWVAEGRPIHYEELRRIIKDFRKRHRFSCGLEIAEWMSNSGHFEIQPGDIALRLTLVAKVHGVEQAESYFHSLNDNLKANPVYGSLLYCYSNAKSLDKAEVIMGKIRELNFLSIINYNAMLKLYSETRNYDKLDLLRQEMEATGVDYDEFTYTVLLNAYGTSSDIGRMEKLLMEMEVNPIVTINPHTFIAVANGYIKAGDIEKALVMLKKAEHLITSKERSVYLFFITVYASIQKKEDVYRLWNLFKSSARFRNMDYSCMISSLEKLDDLEGVKEVFSEWEEKNICFDIRIPNQVIYGLCKRGRLTEAEVILNRLIETDKELNAVTWSRMANGYCQTNSMEKAIEMIKKAFLSSFPKWKPDLPVVAACLEYLKMKGDIDEAKEIIRGLDNCCHFPFDVKERLERYVESGKPSSESLGLG